MIVPSAIIFVNADLVDQVRDWIVNQLHITQYMDGYVFDGYVAANPTWPTDVKLLHQRIMVIRPFNDYTNRNLADVAIFVKEGMAAVEQNRFGPPRPAFPVLNLHWGQLSIY